MYLFATVMLTAVIRRFCPKNSYYADGRRAVLSWKHPRWK